MAATLCWDTGTIRWGREHQHYGDPWEGVVSVQCTGQTARLFAACGLMPKPVQREIVALLRAAGIRTLIWERAKNGKILERRYAIEEE